MDKAYNKIIWQNQPSTATSLGATNLNKMDNALNTIDDRVVGMDTSKANQSTVNGVVQSIAYNDSTGVLTITKVNGTVTTIDTKLEKLAVNFVYNPTTQQLDITLDDGTVQHVDMSALVTQYEFLPTDTISWTIESDGKIKAGIIPGSITGEYLQPDYLADIIVQANIATTQAGIATEAAADAETYRDEALQYRNEAEGIVGLGIATETVPGIVKGAGNVSVRTNGDMWADPYKDKETLTGPSAQCPTADNGLIEITGIQGKYSQVVTVQGKQLFNKAKITAVKYIQPNTGVVTNSNFNNNVSPLIPVTAGQSYTISGHTYVQPNTPVGIAWYNVSGVYISGTSYQNATGNGTYTAPAGAAYVRHTINNVDLNTSQLEAGSTATSYAAYVPNSPSPDYPSVIHNVGDVPFNAVAYGKNLFPPLNSLTNVGITLTQSSDGTITLNGTSTTVALFYVPVYIPLRGNYNLSANNTAISTVSIRLSRNSSGGDYIKDMALDSVNKSLAFNVTSDVISYIGVRIPSGVTLTNYTIKPQLETGSVATPYEPYKGNQTPVTGQYGALPDGTYDERTPEKDIKRKNRIVFDGSSDENWTKTTTNAAGRVRFSIGVTDKKIDGTANGILCDKLTPAGYNAAWTSPPANPTISGHNTNNTLNVFGVMFDSMATAQDFKNWLATNPITVDYALLTPTESPRDRIFVTSYPGITNVYTTDPLQPTFTGVAKSELWSDRRNYLLSLDYDTPHYYYEGKKYLINNPYRSGGVLHLKGQLHDHSTNSDGVQSPTAVVNAYKTAGYNFISITDHNYLTTDPGVTGITFIPGTEETYTVHVTAYDVTEQAQLTAAQDTINFEVARGKLCSIAHPNWESKIIDRNEMVGYYDYNFTEIYNAITNTYADKLIDDILTAGKRVFIIAVDDCHDVLSSAFNKGYVVVHSNTNTKADILESLRKGNFYASTGNDITISLSGNVITATSTGSSNIQFIGMNGRVLQTNNGVTSASYTIIGNEMYIRVKSTKVSDGTFAWSQPVFLETIGGDERHKLDIIRNSNYYGVERQGIENGGFEINQRGVESQTQASGYMNGYFLDRWFNSGSITGVTIPTITRYRRELGIPERKQANYCLGLSWDGAESGTYTGVHTYGLFTRIENGVRNLCGGNKKITLSFYAKATVAGKKLGVMFRQNYGTGGSPSATEDMSGGVFTLKNTFDKYEITVTTKTLYQKIFGSNHNDFLQIGFYYMWNDNFVLPVASERFGGANGIEITQVQLNSGDIALPFCPRPYEEELRLCQRHYEAPQNAMSLYCGYANTLQGFNYRVRKRAIPTVTFKNLAGTAGKLTLFNDGGVSTDITGGTNSSDGYSQVLVNAATAGQMYIGTYEASAEL